MVDVSVTHTCQTRQLPVSTWRQTKCESEHPALCTGLAAALISAVCAHVLYSVISSSGDICRTLSAPYAATPCTVLCESPCPLTHNSGPHPCFPQVLLPRFGLGPHPRVICTHVSRRTRAGYTHASHLTPASPRCCCRASGRGSSDDTPCAQFALWNRCKRSVARCPLPAPRFPSPTPGAAAALRPQAQPQLRARGGLEVRQQGQEVGGTCHVSCVGTGTLPQPPTRYVPLLHLASTLLRCVLKCPIPAARPPVTHPLQDCCTFPLHCPATGIHPPARSRCLSLLQVHDHCLAVTPCFVPLSCC